MRQENPTGLYLACSGSHDEILRSLVRFSHSRGAMIAFWAPSDPGWSLAAWKADPVLEWILAVIEDGVRSYGEGQIPNRSIPSELERPVQLIMKRNRYKSSNGAWNLSLRRSISALLYLGLGSNSYRVTFWLILMIHAQGWMEPGFARKKYVCATYPQVG